MEKMDSCKFNLSINCDAANRTCPSCGWKPDVVKVRKKHNEKRITGNLPERQTWKYV